MTDNKRFQWNYPNEGFRYPRTMEEAFGPYERMRPPNRVSVKSTVCYVLSGVISCTAFVVIMVGRAA